MKSIDLIIITIAITLVCIVLHQFCAGVFIVLLKLLFGCALMATVLYWKLTPYKSQLFPNYKNIYDKVDKVLSPVCGFFSSIPKFQIGNGLRLDLSLVIVSFLLILFLIII